MIAFSTHRHHIGFAHIHGAVEINLLARWDNPVASYIHECLHLQHPEWHEKRVRRETGVAFKKLTQRDAAAILRHIVRRGRVWEMDGEEEAE